MIGQYDDNLPPQLLTDESFNNEPEPKVCPDCNGERLLGRGDDLRKCETCDGAGEINEEEKNQQL